ncbi:hypothetical protein [Neisseria elongata]|jgi:hypothetical protein|uniref:hypothetical protein n=1 Tax=Neisseria elongata TaxID=495 RepID=UPI0020636537|nr:hypothetical protein [Neisseria elongata]DAT56125.1 MAG TPA: hypothetical protein [Caudoviricetes sp.]
MLGVIGTLCFLMVVLCCLIIAVMVVFDLAVGTWRMFFVRPEPPNGWCRELQREIEEERRHQI